MNKTILLLLLTSHICEAGAGDLNKELRTCGRTVVDYVTNCCTDNSGACIDRTRVDSAGQFIDIKQEQRNLRLRINLVAAHSDRMSQIEVTRQMDDISRKFLEHISARAQKCRTLVTLCKQNCKQAGANPSYLQQCAHLDKNRDQLNALADSAEVNSRAAAESFAGVSLTGGKKDSNSQQTDYQGNQTAVEGNYDTSSQGEAVQQEAFGP